MENLEFKRFNFDVEETKQIERDGVKLGIIKGFLATYGNIDRVQDRLEPGSFSQSLKNHQNRGNRPIRMLFQHNRNEVIGGFPIDKVQDMDKGLFVEGEINLEVQKGREAFALAKQGVLSDMSIGFSIIDSEIEDGVRVLKELELWEGSIVDEPANAEAVITEVKKLSVEDIDHINDSRAFEKLLRDLGLSQKAAVTLTSRFKPQSSDSAESKQSDSAAEKELVIPDEVLKSFEQFCSLNK